MDLILSLGKFVIRNMDINNWGDFMSIQEILDYYMNKRKSKQDKKKWKQLRDLNRKIELVSCSKVSTAG